MHICQIPNVIFDSKSHLSFNLHHSSVPSDITPLYFSLLKHYILWSKEPVKEQFFWIFECSSQNLLNSIEVNSSSDFALFFIVMTHNSSVNFQVIPFQLWTKGSHQSPNFDTFKSSCENLPNFSSLFSNHKFVFLQNLHNSSVS